MFPQCRLLREELNALKRIAVEEMCVIVVAKVLMIGYTIVTHFAWFPRVDAHGGDGCIQPFEWSVGRSEVADSCQYRVPEKLVDNSSSQVGLDAHVR